jgi:5-aminopentanamidase
VHEIYGRKNVITAAIDLGKATGMLAGRFRKELYVD